MLNFINNLTKKLRVLVNGEGKMVHFRKAHTTRSQFKFNLGNDTLDY